jgi:uncharacterized protein (TIGR02099 family)
MKKFFRRLVKYLAYTAAVIMILLAIAVGLFRLFLPRVPEYQEEIKGWASAAIGMQVEFSGMDARWRLSGPELAFYDAQLLRQSSGVRIVAAEEVRIGVGLMRLLFEQSLVVERLVIREAGVDIRQTEGGDYLIQGMTVEELLDTGRDKPAAALNIEVIGEEIEVRFMQHGDRRPHFFRVPRVRVSANDNRIAADAVIRLPNELGGQLSVSASELLVDISEERSWDIFVEADDIDLPGWSAMVGSNKNFQSGIGDMELALAFSSGGISNAAAELDFTEISLAGDEFFDLSGRVEFDASQYDWLVAANELVVSFQDHEWPESTLRVEASVDDEGNIIMMDARASYLNLGDLTVLNPWLDEKQRNLLIDISPSGIVRNLIATVSEIDLELPRFDVSAELDRIGILDAPGRPGVRGFSGLLRANRAGGRLEINSDDTEIKAPEYFSDVLTINNADGTVIWRNSNNQTTILSDSIALTGDFFQSKSNVQLIVSKDGTSPDIDLASVWSVSDIDRAKRFIPRKGLSPKLYEWFQMALVSGAITRASTSLQGPLDKFPFDDGEGRLLMEASVRNLTFKYHREWPATEQSDMEVILDNVHLYTTENRSLSAGIPVVNAKVDIPDLRVPVLSIQSFSTGTLEAIHAFSTQSPIAKIFGGQLSRVAVSGEASLNLDLTVPLKRERIDEFEFVARIRSNNGSLAIDGLNPPITDLIGEVTIGREDISSEGLAATFLGEPVEISLERSAEPNFTVVATATGIATAAGIVDGLAPPLEGLINGATSYQARILFPNNKEELQSPLTIQIDSDLEGLGVSLPSPVGKEPDKTLQVYGDIRFMPGGELIESSGFAENLLAWQLAFNRPQDVWDMDRGVITFGGDQMQQADTRGLHIRGTAGVVRLQDWLSLSRSGEKKFGVADRIRSIDLTVDDLFLIGQHLRSHRIKVDRSARDWLVQFDGEDIVGSVFVPYDFDGERAMVLDLERLHLPGDDTETESDTLLDPRTLPAIDLTAQDFAFGDRYLGVVRAQVDKTENGLEAATITTTDESFSIVGNGRWLADDSDPLGSHSYITATLTSTNVETTMSRLDYQPGIVSDDMSMLLNLDWSGGPREEFFDALDGKVEVRFGDGQLEEVEPGAGRMFGLMSIVALPRRLSLDFRDVFAKGFGFDSISGTFNIDDGVTQTCDLSLEGPAADIGIVGEANLVNRTYDQTAIVSANVGNTLPIVGAVVAGPQVAAALLIFSQIFKKPLQEVGQVYYGISGSWDDPDIESTNSAAFVASGAKSGCLPQGE